MIDFVKDGKLVMKEQDDGTLEIFDEELKEKSKNKIKNKEKIIDKEQKE